MWLNDKLHTLLSSKPLKEYGTKDSEKNVKYDVHESGQDGMLPETEQGSDGLQEEDVLPKVQPTIESALSTLITKSTAPILHRAIEENFKDDVGLVEYDAEDLKEEIRGSDPVDIQCSPQMRQRRGRQGRNEVKIYDRIIEG